MQFGTTAVVASALSFGVSCGLPNQPAPTAQTQRKVQPTAQLAAAPSPQPLTPVAPIDPLPLPMQPPIDCALVACVALTFDDGPDPRTTPQLLAALEAQQVRATFFMLGQNITKHPELVRQVKAAGHELGNHTWNHANLTKTPPHQIVNEVLRTQEAFQTLGLEPPHLFRPPYGARDDTVRQLVPLQLILWNVDPKDWAESDPAKIVAHVAAEAKPGAIILLHDIEPASVAAAPQYIKQLKQKYQLVTVSQLLQLTDQTPKGEFSHQP